MMWGLLCKILVGLSDRLPVTFTLLKNHTVMYLSVPYSTYMSKAMQVIIKEHSHLPSEDTNKNLYTNCLLYAVHLMYMNELITCIYRPFILCAINTHR